MSKRKEAIDRDMRELVKLTTGFQERDENFHICASFAESNFKYHRYLSPDSHKIHRGVEGLCEKFEVHSQKQKADDLKELVTAFLEQPGLDGKETGKTDVHYAVLSLLLNLVETPTKIDFKKKEKQVEKEVIDDFDWKSYLLDDEDLNFITYASSDSEYEDSLPDTYDEDDDEEDEDRKKRQNAVVSLERVSRAQDGTQDDPSMAVTVGSDMSDMRTDRVDEYVELERTLVVEYWKGKGREEETSGGHAASNLIRDWNCYQTRMNEFHTARAQTVVTELQVVRETLWMLSGVTELFIFKFNGKEFSLNPDVYVMHLTTESLESSLKPLMRKAGQVFVLQSFINDVVSQVCSRSQSEDDTCVPQTYQAFATSVSEFLSQFRAELCACEKVVMKQDDLVSLEKLTSDLHPWLAKVQAVHGVYICGIASATSLRDNMGSNSDEMSFNNCFRASLLLNVLYQSVVESDLLSFTDTGDQSNIMLRMLIKSSQPLIQITSDWINSGQLSDPAGEFIIQRNKNVKSLDETFWEKAFVSNIQPSVLEASMLDTTMQKSTVSGPSAKPKSATSGSYNTTKSSSHWSEADSVKADSPDFYVKFGPKFLQPILGDAILTGKSMEMLENLGRMGEVLDVGCGVYERPPSLFELFVKDLKAELGSVEDDGKMNQSSTTKQSSSIVSIDGDAAISRQLNMRGERDTLLNINFAALFPDPASQSDSKDADSRKELPSEMHSDLSPLLGLCERCLYPHVRSRYKLVCTRLVHILKSEYHLMDCIHAMQRYYLMSAGEVMYDFYMPIFHKIQNRENWRNSSLLELYLHEAVAPRCPADLSRLSVSIAPSSKQKDKTPIGLTDCIQLKFNVPWPVDVVISGKSQWLYNDIFTFLLQIKRAKYTLDQLRFEDVSRTQAVTKTFPESLTSEDILDVETKEEMPRQTKIHRFQLLRFRLLYFVNSLHNYIMTRILHSTGLEFASKLESATDLEQIITIHKDYVEAIHERCLLHRRLAFLKEAVVKVLNLSLTLGMQWRQGVDFISGHSLEEMDKELTRCIHFLSAFLNNVIKRGSFPHLESLAFALVSSIQHTSPT